MNPIEEMMKLYKVKKKTMCEWTCKDFEFCNASCEYYETKQDVYPPFTPEKQLEIIKLISQRTPFELEIEERDKHTIFTINTDYGSANHFNFEKALAEFLSKIFYYCSTEAQIQQIKEILES